MSGARVLVVDDDVAILRAVRRALEAHGYSVRGVEDGEAAVAAISEFEPEVILLDLVLPDIPGIEVCRLARSVSDAHLIVISAVGDDRRKIEALEQGADDYVTKPFNMDEVEARIRVGLRRRAHQRLTPLLQVGPIRLDLVSHLVTIGGERVHLTPKEFDLLRLLMENQGRVLTQHQILARIWGPEYVDDTHVLRTFIHQLRMKLSAVTSVAGQSIVTDPGVGYRIDTRDS
jgi:two-component system KDP operon response regulator KdpE